MCLVKKYQCHKRKSLSERENLLEDLDSPTYSVLFVVLKMTRYFSIFLDANILVDVVGGCITNHDVFLVNLANETVSNSDFITIGQDAHKPDFFTSVHLI
jgi:hypothetical protein